MERIYTDEVVRAMQQVGWGEYTQPMSRVCVAATKPSKINPKPNSLQCKSRPVSMQGATYADGKKIIGRDLGIEPLNTKVYYPRKISELCREDMRT